MKVIKKQTNSKDCIICGMENNASVKAPFYEMEDGSVVTLFEYKPFHQSYPERTHGGMITCMLDELAGRVIWTVEPKTLAVTSSITVKFRKPVPYSEKLMGIGKLVTNNRRGYTANAVIKTMDGKLLAEADVTYVKLPATTITTQDMDEQLDMFIPDDVTEIDVK